MFRKVNKDEVFTHQVVEVKKVTDLSTVKIVSDGTMQGTKVFSVDGDEIEGITKLTLNMDAEAGVTELVLHVLAPSVELNKKG